MSGRGRGYGDLPIRGSRGGSDRGRGGRGGDRGGRGRGGGGSEGPGRMHSDTVNPPVTMIHNLEDEHLAKSLRTPPDERALARRPGYGTLGRPVLLRANFFDMDFRPGIKFHSYQIKIKPTTIKKNQQIFALEKFLRNYEPFKGIGVATDGATEIVTTERLPDNPPIYTVSMPVAKGRGSGGRKSGENHNGPWDIRLVHKVSVSIHDLKTSLRDNKYQIGSDEAKIEAHAVRMLNILMSSYPYKTPGIKIIGKGRNKVFRLDGRKQSFNMKGGIEAIRGYYSSVRLTAGRIMLNLNISHGSFYKPINLADLIEEFRVMFKENREVLDRYVKRLKVFAQHLDARENGAGKMEKPVKTIWGLANPKDGGRENPPHVKRLGSSADNVSFYWKRDDGKSGYVAVTEYFLQHYNRQLKHHGDCPVVNVGSQQNPVYLPAELCEVLPGQIFGGDPTSDMRSAMIKFSCRKPPQNYESIMTEGLEIMGISNNKTRDVGIKLSEDMTTVPARILNAPNLLYAKKATKTAFGSWNLIRTKFSEGATIKSWTCVSILKRGNQGFNQPVDDQDMASLFTNLREHGLTLPTPSKPYHNVKLLSQNQSMDLRTAERESRKLIKEKLEALKKAGIELLVVILPDKERSVFDYVKYVGDVELGILTHCMLAEKFHGANEQYISNNAMKINLKMGGCNQLLEPSGSKFISQGKTMVVGLDVTHPTTIDADNTPSIAGIVASIDGRMGQWPGQVRGQKSRQECIEHLGSMIAGRIRVWIRRNGQPPANILIYRDGVSEGQFHMVLHEELKEIIAGCNAVKEYNGKLPKITVIVCGKRHHVRFYPTQMKDQDRTHNPINGSVVDRGVTRPSNWDFYLQAQTPLQGSARPAHYIVIHDEIFTNPQINQGNKPADLVQDLTHNICYMMGRATRSISYATPAFLADRYCDRARAYLLAWLWTQPNPREIDPAKAKKCVESEKFDRTMAYI